MGNLGNHCAVKEVQIKEGIEELIRSAELLVVTLRTLKQSTHSDLVEELEGVCDSLAIQVGEGIKKIDYSGFLIDNYGVVID